MPPLIPGKAQIMLTFIETSPQGKLWIQVMKVADTNGDKS